MSSLKETESLLFELITAPEGVAQALRESGRSASDLARMIVGDSRLSSVGRLDIYANMYFYRILDVLKADFPSVLSALGEADFHNLVTDYLLAFPSSHPSLRNVGAQLPAFLLTRTPAWLADLARLEWTRHDLFDGTDDELLTLATLQAIAPEQFAELPLKMVRAARLIELEFSVDDYGSAAGESVEKSAAATEPYRQSKTVLVWRQGTHVSHRALDPFEIRAAQLIVSGARFGYVCDLAVESYSLEEAPTRAFQLLSRLVNEQLLIA